MIVAPLFPECLGDFGAIRMPLNTAAETKYPKMVSGQARSAPGAAGHVVKRARTKGARKTCTNEPGNRHHKILASGVALRKPANAMCHGYKGVLHNVTSEPPVLSRLQKKTPPCGGVVMSGLLKQGLSTTISRDVHGL